MSFPQPPKHFLVSLEKEFGTMQNKVLGLKKIRNAEDDMEVLGGTVVGLWQPGLIHNLPHHTACPFFLPTCAVPPGIADS